MSDFKLLNNIYEKLHLEKEIIKEVLDSKNHDYEIGYYPFHSIKNNDVFSLEQYPIPVFSVNKRIDIGIDIHHIFFEFRFKREKAIDLDFFKLQGYTFEVYGIQNYLEDYYINNNIEGIKVLIEKSSEKEIGISIHISKDNIAQRVSKITDFILNL